MPSSLVRVPPSPSVPPSLGCESGLVRTYQVGLLVTGCALVSLSESCCFFFLRSIMSGAAYCANAGCSSSRRRGSVGIRAGGGGGGWRSLWNGARTGLCRLFYATKYITDHEEEEEEYVFKQTSTARDIAQSLHCHRVKNEEEAFGAINIWNVKNKQQERGIDINTRERQRAREIRSDQI